MPLTAPPAAPDAPGTAPSRSDPSTFRTLADAYVTWQSTILHPYHVAFRNWAATNVTEMDALQTDVAAKQSTASTAATNAATSATNAGTSETNAATSATAAATSETNAATSATAAASAKTAAETARDSALTAGRIYADTTAGLAAVASGEYFCVPSSNTYESLILYKDNAGVAEEVKRFPSTQMVDDAFHERFFASQARAFEDKRTRVFVNRKKQALILYGDGQSNNAAYNTPVSGVVTSTAYEFVGGNAVGEHQFYGANQAHSVNWDDVASVVPFTTAAVEHPLSGALTMLEGVFPAIYAHSGAYGGNAILMLSGAARLANLCAYLHQMCDIARADGYEPVVAFTFVQGEANMSSFGLITEEQYYTYGSARMRQLQRVAAQAMDRPDYKAPIVIHNPAQSQNGADSRAINNALIRIAAETPNAILGSCLNQWNVNADLIHGTAVGFRQRGEQDGWLLSKFFLEGKIFKGLRMVDAYRVGNLVTVTLNGEAERDATATFASSLNATKALAGFEYSHDGTTYVQVSAVTVSGRRAVLTLASDPGAHAGTEEVRLAMQTSPASGTWPQQAAGSQIRSTTERFVSPYDGTTQYVWASPCKLSVR
jgi:hypothetical protein